MSTSFKTGRFENYTWIESRDISLSQLFSVLQKDIVGTTMVVATFDSGSISPSEEEIKMGWSSKNEALYAPKLGDIKSIPWDNYDEIYFYDSVPDPIKYKRFVNIGAFSMVDPLEKLKAANQSWDLVGIEKYGELELERQLELKQQVLLLKPKLCVLNGDNVIVFYREKEIGAKLEKEMLK